MSGFLKNIMPADVLDHEGVEYRETSGTSGEQLNIRECPTCGNSKWKVYMNAENGYANCFVCSTTFNIWTFVQDLLGTMDKRTIHDTFAAIEKAYSFTPKKRVKVLVSTEDEELTAKLPMSIPLPTASGKNSPYLEERGISAKYAGQFKLRWCQYGVHNYKIEDREISQRFDGRIIIPIFDLDGELVTFQGRDISGSSDKKYLFPAKLPATGRFLFNGHEALARRSKNVIMNEGVFDVIPVAIACDIFDEMVDVTAIGSFGKHLSNNKTGDSQVDAFRRLKKEGALETVTIMWDGEAAALLSALETAKVLTKIGLKVRVALLPKGKDPNEVDAVVIKDAYINSVPYSRMMAVRYMTKNPYK